MRVRGCENRYFTWIYSARRRHPALPSARTPKRSMCELHADAFLLQMNQINCRCREELVSIFRFSSVSKKIHISWPWLALEQEDMKYEARVKQRCSYWRQGNNSCMWVCWVTCVFSCPCNFNPQRNDKASGLLSMGSCCSPFQNVARCWTASRGANSDSLQIFRVAVERVLYVSL